MYQTSNSKLSNRERILACIFRNPSISRTGIAQLTGITPATVSHTIFQLQQEHFPGRMAYSFPSIVWLSLSIAFCSRTSAVTN